MAANNEARSDDGAHLEAALGYLKNGWAVVPAGERAKHPIVPWQAYQHRMPTEAELTAWFERWPKANLSVITGAVSGIVVIDIDPRNGGDGSLAALEASYGATPSTIESVTGGGGRHLYFAHPGREIRNRVGLAPGIDLRGDGGCIIVPPSVHPSGKRYRWKAGRAPGQALLAPLPVWLEMTCLDEDGPRGHSTAYWRKLVQQGAEEGHRNSTIASFAGHLLWHGVDPEVVVELMLAWNRMRCRPPLDDVEVSRTVQSIARTHGRATV